MRVSLSIMPIGQAREAGSDYNWPDHLASDGPDLRELSVRDLVARAMWSIHLARAMVVPGFLGSGVR